MIPTRPGELFRYVLSEHKEMESPVVFLLECLSGRQQLDLMIIKEVMPGQPGNSDDINAIFGAIEPYVKGWENLDKDFDTTNLFDVINVMDAIEIMAVLVFQSPSIEDKKKSKSQSDGSGDSSVTSPGDVPE